MYFSSRERFNERFSFFKWIVKSLPVNSFYVAVPDYKNLFTIISRTSITMISRNNFPSWCFKLVFYIPFCYVVFRSFSVCNVSLYVIAFNQRYTVMQIEKALINHRLRVLKVSWKFCTLTILNFAVIHSWNLLFS